MKLEKNNDPNLGISKKHRIILNTDFGRCETKTGFIVVIQTIHNKSGCFIPRSGIFRTRGIGEN